MSNELSQEEWDSVFEQHAVACVSGDSRQFELAERLRAHDATLRERKPKGPHTLRPGELRGDWSRGGVGPEGLSDE